MIALIRRLFSKIPGLPESKEVLSIPKDPAEFTPSEWFQMAVEKSQEDEHEGLCCPWPDCKGHMLEGPSGGAAMNVKCDTCERKWNLMIPIGVMERI